MIAYPEAIQNAWLPICAVFDVKQKPLRRFLHGVPLVVFQSGKGISVLKDRCPHRNVPLSEGRVVDGAITCPYHGWAFAGDGACIKVPGGETSPRLCAEALPVEVRAGFVFTTLAREPLPFPALPVPLEDPAFDHGIWITRFKGTLIDGMENLLDPSHPHYLHPRIVGGSGKRIHVDVEFEEHERHLSVVYHEQERRRGWLPALMEGKRLKATAAFYPPTFCQLGFIGAKGPQLFITAMFSPEGREDHQALAVFSTPKGFLPAWFKRWALIRFHTKIIQQDQAMIRMQLDNLKSFGGPHYKMGPLDFVKPSMVKLMNGETLTPSHKVMTSWL